MLSPSLLLLFEENMMLTELSSFSSAEFQQTSLSHLLFWPAGLESRHRKSIWSTLSFKLSLAPLMLLFP